MNTQNLNILFRRADRGDCERILRLYQLVAAQGNGIARAEDEIDERYVFSIIDRAATNGLMLVAYDNDVKIIVGCIHAMRSGLKVFSHVLTDLSVLVHPAYQRKGIGKKLFTTFLEIVQTNHPSVLRVELFCRVSNQKALRMYEQLGFVREGRFEKRVLGNNNSLEADIAMVWFNPMFHKKDGTEKQVVSLRNTNRLSFGFSKA